jgi:hypothetical protein
MQLTQSCRLQGRFLVGGSTLHAIERRTAGEAAAKQGNEPAIGPTTAKQTNPFYKSDAAKERIFWRPRNVLAIC